MYLYSHRHPGAALFDYDSDGDIDIFVTNGPGTEHSLFQNQWVDTGNLSFIDVAIRAGFGGSAALKQDGSGVCYGDIDNDGDNDILVLGSAEYNYLYQNNGEGTFTLLPHSGLSSEAKQFHSTSCSFGDIDNDGFIDVAIANAAIDSDKEYNELYYNNGDGTFTDVSDRIAQTVFDDNRHNYNGTYDGEPTMTWAIEMVDINMDGFVDIVHADDTLGALPPFGPPKAIVHIFFNQGNGQFIDVPNTIYRHFMGNSAADINCDGNMDLFLSDFGASQWYLGNGKGRVSPTNTFTSPFGWGNAIFDYDNDGDLDILYHGGTEDKLTIIANNPVCKSDMVVSYLKVFFFI